MVRYLIVQTPDGFAVRDRITGQIVSRTYPTVREATAEAIRRNSRTPRTTPDHDTYPG